jgi:hypothetical protein
MRRIESQEEHAEAENPRKHAADNDVVRPRPAPERSHTEGDEDSHREEPEPQVESGRERRERTGERHMGQRVRGEDLGPQHEEIADQTGGERDRGAGEERVPHEGVGEDVAERG